MKDITILLYVLLAFIFATLTGDFIQQHRYELIPIGVLTIVIPLIGVMHLLLQKEK